METMNKKPFAERSHFTVVLVEELLSRGSGGEVVTYQELNEAAKINVQADGRRYLQSARNIMLSQYGMLFDTIPKVGLILANNDGVLKMTQRSICNAHRGFKRSKKKLTKGISKDSLDPNQTAEYLKNHSLLSFFEGVTKTKTLKRIEDAFRVMPDKLEFNSKKIAWGGMFDQLLENNHKEKEDV